MIEHNDMKASKSVSATLALLQGRNGAAMQSGSLQGIADQAAGSFGQTFAKFTQAPSSLLTDPSMLTSKTDLVEAQKRRDKAGASSSANNSATGGAENSAAKAANMGPNKKPVQGPSDRAEINSAAELKQRKAAQADNESASNKQAPPQKTDADKGDSNAANQAKADSVDENAKDQAEPPLDQDETGEEVASGVNDSDSDLVFALGADDLETQPEEAIPIVGAQQATVEELTEPLPEEASDLDMLDLEMALEPEAKRDGGDQDKSSKLQLRAQSGQESDDVTLRGLGERMGRQAGEGAAEGESHQRARAQLFAEALSQNTSKTGAGGAEKATAQLSTGPLGLRPQAPLSGQAATAAAEAARFVTRLNTPFQQPAWTEMMQGRVMWMIQSEMKAATVYIDPPELGPVHITIQQSGDSTQVNFQVQSQSVRESLEQSAHRLRESLGEQGFTQVDVNVRGGDRESAEGQGDQNAEHGGAGSSLVAGEGEDLSDTEQVHQPLRPDGTLGLVNTYA